MRRFAGTSPECRRCAFSLVELTLVMMIIGVFSAIAAPRFGSAIARHRINAAARRLSADLALARQYAIQTSSNQDVVFDVVQDTYTLSGMKHPDDAAKTYDVRLSDELYHADIFSADFGGSAVITFDYHGTPSSAGTVVLVVGSLETTIAIDGDTGRTPPISQLQITLRP